jgi:integrase
LINTSFWAKIGPIGFYLLERVLATINYRGPYQWRAKIRRTGYPEQSKTFLTKVEAEAWVRDIESKIDQGIFIDRSALEKTKLLDILDRYEKEITPTKKGQTQEKSKLKILKNSKLSGLSLAAIRTKDIVNYRNERSKEVAAATVGREINLLSHVFNIARTEWGLPGLSNPVQGIRRLKLPQGRNRRASVDELQRIIAASESPVLKVLIPFAIETAMRRGELVLFEWKDIDFDKQTIFLRTTKNGSARTVPLSTKAMALLQALPKTEGKVFGVRADTLTQAFSRSLQRARKIYEQECMERDEPIDAEFLTKLRLHDMRHEATSRLVEDKNLQMAEVMAVTGHKDIRSMMRYTHLQAHQLAKKLG